MCNILSIKKKILAPIIRLPIYTNNITFIYGGKIMHSMFFSVSNPSHIIRCKYDKTPTLYINIFNKTPSCYTCLKCSMTYIDKSIILGNLL